MTTTTITPGPHRDQARVAEVGEPVRQAINDFPGACAWLGLDRTTGLCGLVSGEFRDLLKARGIEAYVVWFVYQRTGAYPKQDAFWQARCRPRRKWQPFRHVVVWVRLDQGGIFIDWTARQFDPDADCPRLFTDWPQWRWLVCEEKDVASLEAAGLYPDRVLADPDAILRDDERGAP